MGLLVDTLRRGKPLDMDSYDYRNSKDVLNSYLELGIFSCVPEESMYDMYDRLIRKVESVNFGYASILDKILENEALYTYMYTHIVFDADDCKAQDKIVKYFLSKFRNPMDYVEKYLMRSSRSDILEKYSSFNPVEVTWVDEDVTIKVGLWKRDSNGRVLENPIHVIEEDNWPVKVPLSKVESMLMSAGVVICGGDRE